MKDNRNRRSGQRRRQNNQNQNQNPNAKGQGHKNTAPREPVVKVVYPEMDCVICGEKIGDITNAIAYSPEGGPAHFDCVLRHLNQHESLVSGERIVYLGSGHFGVITADPSAQQPFLVVRKIPVEDLKELPAWRREIKSQLKR